MVQKIQSCDRRTASFINKLPLALFWYGTPKRGSFQCKWCDGTSDFRLTRRDRHKKRVNISVVLNNAVLSKEQYKRRGQRNKRSLVNGGPSVISQVPCRRLSRYRYLYLSNNWNIVHVRLVGSLELKKFMKFKDVLKLINRMR